jgi:hypothetical protein
MVSDVFRGIPNPVGDGGKKEAKEWESIPDRGMINWNQRKKQRGKKAGKKSEFKMCSVCLQCGERKKGPFFTPTLAFFSPFSSLSANPHRELV